MTDSVDLEHSSTHSLNSGCDYKEVSCLQLQSVAKISRGELEDLYYQLHDENIEIKKKFNSLDNKYKIMATRVMRLSRDHKCLESIDREEDQRQLLQLRQNEATLRAKLTVLKGQLASHTQLHSAALSKAQRLPSYFKVTIDSRGPCGKDDDSVLGISRTGSQSRGQSRHRSSSLTSSQHGALKDQHGLSKVNACLQEEVAHLQSKISALQKEMLQASEKSNTRICELEAELSKHLDKETSENIELIKARRLSKQHETALISLQQELQLTQRELQACKEALTLAARDQDELCSTLMKERQKTTDLQQENVKLTQTCSSMRDLEEQLKDAKKENAILKEHSNRLLQLKSGVIDARNSPRGDSTESSHVILQTSHEDQFALLKDNASSKQKIDSLKQEQLNLQQQIKETQDEISDLHKKLLQAKDDLNNLNEEHAKVLRECLKLRTELAEPKGEKARLCQELADINNECSRLVEELSKSKSKLEEQRREQADLQHASQGKKATNISLENGLTSSSFPVASISNRQLFHAHQLSPGSNYFLSTPQSHSHPCTPRPRPRTGDACLALLEQTAIRPSSSSFPGVFGSHGSLQERFLELCNPNTPPPSTSTPLPPASIEEGSKNTSNLLASTSEDVHESSSIHASPKVRSSSYSHLQSGQTNTQWELDKCRELLRVQFNLNSIYKKEVASLSNIVQSLTSGKQTEVDSK
ncbi:Protein fantom [Frankliniella fusca]|uniref:Protein fantom n=1 Tax=Frankliniella fusca TaxID=407009 RepID=A0AAE1LE88_9NEOP|nr:Protein fantom [Frankliniella fusca]